MKVNTLTCILLLGLTATPLSAQEKARSTPPGTGSTARPARRGLRSPVAGLEGKIEYYLSAMDGKRRPYAVCATGPSDAPRPMIVEVSPGGTNLEGAKRTVAFIAGTAAKHGLACVAVRPTGRGPGSVNQNYGEVDTLEAIDDAARKYHADPDRISVTGSSMGGAATWYLTSHNPDFFSAGAPFCGYCDYRLWEKPGGCTFHMHPWEEPSWKARSAVMLIENFQHTPLWISHGEWDRAVGGGVPVEQSRRMAGLLEEKGFAHTYTEVPKTGHGCRTPELWEKVILWLLKQKKTRNPDHVMLATYELRHNRSYWVGIEQLEKAGTRASVDAQRVDDGRGVRLTTQNVRTLSLGPVDGAKSVALGIDGQATIQTDLTVSKTFRRDKNGTWQEGSFDLSGEKRHGSSGPIGDLFHENLILVPGTAGSDDASFFQAMIAGNARRYYGQRNGGVHRGGIMGENNVQLPIVSDAQLSDEQRRGNNLLLYGTYATNSVLKQFEGKLPLEFHAESIDVGDKTFRGDKVAVFAVFPHPENPSRYVAVHGGVTPEAVTWGSHLDMQLLPDYIAYSGGEVLEWGFWNNQWKSPK